MIHVASISIFEYLVSHCDRFRELRMDFHAPYEIQGMRIEWSRVPNKDVVLESVTILSLVLFCFVSFFLFRVCNLVVKFGLCYPSFGRMYLFVLLVHSFFFISMCLSFMIGYVIPWGIYSHAHCDLEAWLIMEDIELIDLELEILLESLRLWLIYLMINAVLHFAIPHFDLVNLHPPILSIGQYHP